ncbi:signal peptidase I [Patescibacteria group bacterium]|nr:signal peptidase I [Patescibacteria group bacterium]
MNQNNEQDKPKTKKSTLKRVIRTAIGTILWIALVAGLIWGLPRALSWYLKTPYPMAAITSGSMWPALHTSDLVFIQGVTKAEEQVEVGDIVVFVNKKNAFTIHRVMEKNEATLITKGDANNVADPAISYDDVIGKLYTIGDWNARIPKLGFISTTVSKYRE